MKNFDKNKILWILFGLAGLFSFLDFTFEMFFQGIILFKALSYAFIVLSLTLHIIWTFSISKGIFFILLTFSIGLITEIIGVNYGSAFGVEYIYGNKMVGTMVSGVPIFIPFFWTVFIYTGYSMSSWFIKWLGMKEGNLSTLSLLILLDIIIVVSIDLFMDPIMVENGYWQWGGGGSYFGVPIRNFIGWGGIVLLSSGIFRTYEFITKKDNLQELTSAKIIPFIGYISLFVLFLLNAIILKLFILSIVGISVMMPISVLSIMLIKSKRNQIFV